MNLKKYLKAQRNAIRLNPYIARLQYTLGNLYCRWAGRLCRVDYSTHGTEGTVAICLRFRNEAHYLSEWIEYYLAAGVAHFFLYNNYSDDAYLPVLEPYITGGVVTLIDWPHVPASPTAEEDCIRRAVGKFAWVGFLDADEFVVIRDGRSIPDFLSEFQDYPGVALHWIYFGSNGYKQRPRLPVIEAYTRRRSTANIHVKVFIRPDAVTQCANSHVWYFRGGRAAVDEDRLPVWGSRSPRASAKRAWINHYYSKSEEDYLKKTQQKSTLDRSGMVSPSRTAELMQHHMTDNNEVECLSAVEYRNSRLALTGKL